MNLRHFLRPILGWPIDSISSVKKQTRKLLSENTTKTLIHAFVTSHIDYCNSLGKVRYEPRRPTRPALISGFCSMKQLGVFLLPPGWDASPSQGYPHHFRRYPFIHLGGERNRESKVSCPRTQSNVPGQDPNLALTFEEQPMKSIKYWYYVAVPWDQTVDTSCYV